jgi:ankyrin repeat protein
MVLSLLLLAALQIANAETRLVDAVKKADRAAVRAFLDKRVDVNGRAPDGATALHWAVHKDDLETAGMLIRAGANVKSANPQGVTPLSLAALNGNAAMIELLLKAGADPNTALPEGETVLMTAARTGRLDAVKVLLARGADVNAKETWRGQTALMWAAAEGHAEVVQVLAERGADVKIRSTAGFTPFLFAVREGKIPVVRTLLEAGANVNETLPLTNRRRPGNSTVTEPGTGPSALVLAVANAHYELAALLLDRGADPNAAAQGWTALHQITWIRKPGAGSNNPAPEGSGNMDSLALVRKLAAHGANLNARVTKQPNAGVTDLNMLGGTPFLLAARTADAELMRLLAQLGADPLLSNEDNTTPLMVAAGVGVRSPGEDPGTANEVFEAVKVAWELGGDVNAADKNGQTAMHGAAYKQVPAVAQFLLDKGAKIDVWNRKNMNGWTPLRIAAGVHRGMNFRSAPAVAAVLTKVMSAAGLSTEVEPEGLISGATK